MPFDLRPPVENLDEVRHCAGGSGTNRGTGGMITKINAAEIAISGSEYDYCQWQGSADFTGYSGGERDWYPFVKK